MTNYTSFLDSYVIEATYGTSAIPAAATSTFLFGIINPRAKHPNPRYTPRYGATAVAAREPAADGIGKASPVYQGNMTVILQNGVPLWLAMGKSVTAGVVHTITPAYLPSITLQHDRTGTATDWGIQYRGVMCSHLKLMDDRRSPGLIANLDWVARTAVDPGWILTSTPALPATATTDPYYQLVTATYDGVSMDGLVEFEFQIDPGLKAIMGNWWSAGVDMQHVPVKYVENFMRKYRLILKGYWENDDLWDDGVSPTNTSKNMVFKWQKSAADYIQITMTDVEIMDPETISPSDGQAYEMVECVPTQVSIAVSDGLAAAAYGE